MGGGQWAEVSGRRSVVAQGGGVAASAVPQNSQNFSKLSEFSEFSEFLEFFRIFAKSLKSQNFRKIQNFRSLYGIFSRIVKGGDSHIAFYFPKVIYYLLSVLLSPSNILLSAPSFPYNILLSVLLSPRDNRKESHVFRRGRNCVINNV